MSALLISIILQANLLIGTFGGHSYTAEYNLETLEITQPQAFAAADAAFICFGDAGEIYAVSEGSVPGACSYDPQHLLTGYCSQVGKSPCFIARIPGKPLVAVTSYGEGRISVLSTNGSMMGEAVQQIQFRGHGPVLTNDAQVHARAHSIRPIPDALGGQGKWMLAADLGSDRIRVLKVTNRARRPLRHCWWRDARTPQGTGPRHMEFNEQAGLLYVIGELSGEIIVYSVNGPRLGSATASCLFLEKVSRLFSAKAPRLKMVQRIQAEEVGAGASADIHLHPNGRWLYASHRNGNDGISIFEVAQLSGAGEPLRCGLLRKIGYSRCGNHPRNFAIAPDGRSILVGCKNDKSIESYPIDPETGLIGTCASVLSFSEDEPVCLLFM